MTEIPDPKTWKLVFPDTTIYAHCWCRCGWEIYPTGWYDSDGPTLLEDLVSIWQDAHDMGGKCRRTILWEEVDD